MEGKLAPERAPGRGRDEVALKVNVMFFAVAGALALPSGPFASGPNDSVSRDLIVVQIPASSAPRVRARENLSTPLDRYVGGARIVRVDPSTREAVVLTPEFSGACDPDVSPDGEAIVFAGQRTPKDSWQIWTMRADGSGKAQITRSPGRSVAPVFAGARFYLDDPQPTPQIIFAGATEDPGPFALYGTDLQGVTQHRLTFNLDSDFSPAVLPTGQVVFTSWQRYGDPSEPDGHFALLAVNIDGTDLMPFYGNHEPPRYRDMAAVSSTRDRVYFVESDQVSWLGGGALAYVSWRRPLHSYRRLAAAPGDRGVFHSPTPLPDGGLLASYRDLDSDSVFAIYRLDPESGTRVERVFREDGWHSIDAQVLAPRPTVKGRSNWLRPGSTTGVFYCLDCYRTNPGEHDGPRTAPPGSIKHVRVIEGQPRRILGVAPVEEDGSFHIRVPAETPITFQLLDEDYVALRTQRAWTWVMGNENRGCIGCHEDPEISPPNRMVKAVTKPAVDLVLPPGRRRAVDFRHEIAPILASSCATAGCHVPGGVSPALGSGHTPQPEPDLHAVYDALLKPGTGPSERGYVVVGSAKESPLIRLLLGKDAGVGISPGMEHEMLTRRDLVLFIEWVDLGAEWDVPRGRDGGGP